jgi:hypothetical protein
MPSCFQLIDRVTGEPTSLSLVDDRICKEVYNCEPHPRFYGGNVFNWFDSIGFQLAMSKDLDDNSDKSVRKYYQESELWADELPIIEKTIDFLQTNYTEKSWYEVVKS